MPYNPLIYDPNLQIVKAFQRHIKSGSIGIINITEIRTRQCRVPTRNWGRDTALPCPLYHSGVTGIDMTNAQYPIPHYQSIKSSSSDSEDNRGKSGSDSNLNISDSQISNSSDKSTTSPSNISAHTPAELTTSWASARTATA